MKNEINYLRLAMDESSGMFAWHFFGVCNAVHEGGYAQKDSPDEVAREYLETFHAEALAEAENNSEKALDASV